VFGLPSLRIKGLYLAITTLAAQFFLEWCFLRVRWLYNFNDSGAIEVPNRELLGITITGAEATPVARYLLILTIVAFMTLIAANVLRGRIGRSWMMIRDMDIAAELMGIKPLAAKLSAFAFSSYYCGVAGALMVFCWLFSRGSVYSCTARGYASSACHDGVRYLSCDCRTHHTDRHWYLDHRFSYC